MQKNSLTHTQYLEQFPMDKGSATELSIREKALAQAIAIRQFEITLYWQRATYFWVFIGSTFVAYAAFSTTISRNNAPDALVWISCVGVVFSVAWHCVNKGSKFWQENWENHVELLEDKIHGPLYKTITERPPRNLAIPQSCNDRRNKFSDFFVAPVDFSVSKINQIVSTFIAWAWAFLLLHSCWPIHPSLAPNVWRIIPIVGSLFTCGLFWFSGKSHKLTHTPYANKRDASVKEQRNSAS